MDEPLLLTTGMFVLCVCVCIVEGKVSMLAAGRPTMCPKCTVCCVLLQGRALKEKRAQYLQQEQLLKEEAAAKR